MLRSKTADINKDPPIGNKRSKGNKLTTFTQLLKVTL